MQRQGFVWGVFLSLLLCVLGFTIEFVSGGRGVILPSWPGNLYLLMLMLSVIIPTALLFRTNRFVQWLGGIPLGLCLIVALAVLSMFGGVLPQEQGAVAGWMERLGFNRMFSSWPFSLVMLAFLGNIGLSLVWKCVPFRFGNLQFILFHAGFWISMACGLLGSADLQRVIIPLYEGRFSSHGYLSSSKEMVEMPFRIYLEDFIMEEYPPQLALYDPETMQLELDETNTVHQVAEGLEMSWPEGVRLKVLHYLPFAMMRPSGEPVAADRKAGVPYVFVEGEVAGRGFSSWLSTGSPYEDPLFAGLGEKLLVLVPGTAKKYSSRVVIEEAGGNGVRETVVDVNAPVSVGGWKIYQMGYDENAGRWSKQSLLEGVRDPWLPIVYAGFFMMLGGNFLFFWNGMKKTKVL